MEWKCTPLFAVFFLFVSFFTVLQCSVVLVHVCISFFFSAYIWIGYVSHCVCPNWSRIFLSLFISLLSLFSRSLSVCADWPRSPLAHGCRSTHNSPVHSACSSQRLSQNFSVSVPTLIFTGMQRQGRELVQHKATFLNIKSWCFWELVNYIWLIQRMRAKTWSSSSALFDQKCGGREEW